MSILRVLSYITCEMRYLDINKNLYYLDKNMKWWKINRSLCYLFMMNSHID